KGLKVKKSVALEGVCHFYNEQGLETVYWVFWDSKHILPPTTQWPHERWDYKGLWILKDDDHLTIFDKKTGKKIVWSGFISLWTDRIGRIHQRDVSSKKWKRWFNKEYPAKFIPGPNQTKLA
ncbi:MAG TPA: hypothetical protein VJC06_01630, partial [Candidatus Paceibacterota bacterium]